MLLENMQQRGENAWKIILKLQKPFKLDRNSTSMQIFTQTTTWLKGMTLILKVLGCSVGKTITPPFIASGGSKRWSAGRIAN